MDHTIIKKVLNNGSKNFILHCYLESIGGSDLVHHDLISPELYDTLVPPSDRLTSPNMKLTITQIWHSFSWFDALLSFDSVSPSPSWVLTRDSNCHVDFRHFGGLADRYVDPQDKTATDRTGKILLSTRGFDEVGSIGTLILEIRKSID